MAGLIELEEMATNTNSNVFRTLDVDKYSEDTYKEDLDITEVAAPVSENGDQDSVLESLLAAGKASEALSHVLATTALGLKDQGAREANLAAAMRVMMGIKTSQIDAAVAELDNEHRDILMKVIYRGFENPSEGSSGHLLVWHEKVFALAGVGSIVRVMTDKKTV